MIPVLLLAFWYWDSGTFIISGTIINFGVFWESGTIILVVLLFGTLEYDNRTKRQGLVDETSQGGGRKVKGWRTKRTDEKEIGLNDSKIGRNGSDEMEIRLNGRTP